MKAIIVGAGIGGLTTAVALQEAGIDFEIYEAAPELRPVGAGIVMASNAIQVFQRLGIEKKIMKAGLEIVDAFGVDQNFKLILLAASLFCLSCVLGGAAFARGGPVIYPGNCGVGMLGSSAERISVYAAQLLV